MDQILKARKMSSASARRKRIQDREVEETQAQERYIEHKRRIMLYDHLADQDSLPTDSDENNHSDASQHKRGESVTTPSDCSVVTPNDTPTAPSVFEKAQSDTARSSVVPKKPQLHLVLPDSSADTTGFSVMQPSPGPKLQASLVARSDFVYDRYSMLIDLPDPSTSPAETVSTPDLEYEDDYSPSPVEIATPVSMSLPKTRPSVISISSRSNKKRRTITVQSPLSQETRSQSPQPPSPPPRSVRRLSASSTRSGFLASEAQPLEVPNLPSNASSLIESAKRDSVALSLSGDGTKAMHRKSSQPLLSAIKTSHARMSSIKSMIKSPTHNPSPSASSSRPESRSSRPPTSAADMMNDSFQAFETVPANLYDPPPTPGYRSRTSYYPSRPSTSSTASRQASVTALPTAPHLISYNSYHGATEAEPHPGQMRRKKSFSSLRKHRASISQAFKSVATRNVAAAGHTPKLSQHQQQDIPSLPPLPQPPTLIRPRQDSTVELSSFPAPPLSSPNPSLSARSGRSRRSVASYSMFPPSPKVGNETKGGYGLGFGLKV